MSDDARLVWRRSTKCESGLCVEVATPGFRTSTRCGPTGDCVEVGPCGCAAGGVLVRDSKTPAGPVLSFDARSWEDLLAGIRAGEFDRP